MDGVVPWLRPFAEGNKGRSKQFCDREKEGLCRTLTLASNERQLP
jgi:hypothetical protein